MNVNAKSCLVFQWVFAGLFLVAQPLFADISASSDFKGMLVITQPSGEVSIVEQGEPLPAIAKDSNVEVFNGDVLLSTAQNDKVEAACLNHHIVVEGGASIQLACGEAEGLLKVVKSKVQLTDAKGVQSILEEGAEYRILAQKVAAPATAAGDLAGGPAVGGDLGDAPPVDSRNLDASPR